MPGGLTTPQAHALFTARWRKRFGRAATPTEMQSLLCVSRFDGGYGSWPAGSNMVGSKNMGGIQCTWAQDAAGGGATFTCAMHETFEIINGQRKEMRLPFRYYATWEDAADDYLAQMTGPRRPLTQKALATGDLSRVSDAMHREHYFTAAPSDYAAAIWAQAKPIAKMLQQPLLVALHRPGNSPPWLLLAAAAAALYLATTGD